VWLKQPFAQEKRSGSITRGLGGRPLPVLSNINFCTLSKVNEVCWIWWGISSTFSILFHKMTHQDALLISSIPHCKNEIGSRPIAVGWHGVANATLGQQDASFLPLLRITLHISYCCIIILAKEISPKIIDKLNLGLFNILESSIFSCTHIINWNVIT